MDGTRRRARGWAGLVFQTGTLLVYLGALAALPIASNSAGGRDNPAPLTGAVGQVVERALAAIEPVAQRCGSDDPPDWRAFARALDAGGGPEQAVVAWAPHVSETERTAYEADTGRDAFRSFFIREPDRRGVLQPAAARVDHFPVHLVHPAPQGNRLLGLDLLSDPAVGAAIVRAGRSNAPQVLFASTAWGPGGEPGLVVLVPVVRNGRLAGVMVAALPAPVPAAAGGQRLVTRPRPP